MKTIEPTHLNDGAYAGHDGYQIWLGANHHENMTVALDPYAFHELVKYAHKTLGWRVDLPPERGDLSHSS